MNYHHKAIKRFEINGQIYDEAHIDRLRTEYRGLLVSSMRCEGYVERIDLNSDFTLSYNGASKGFDFRLSVFGVFVGKKKAQGIKYVDGYKPALEDVQGQAKESVDKDSQW